MKKLLIFAFAVFAYQTAFAQPNVWGATKLKFENGDTSYIRTANHFKDYIAAYFAGGGTVTTVSVVTANGLAGTVANPTTTPAITLTTSVNAPVLAGNGTAISAATTTGTGSTVALSTSPTFVTPILGTPTSATLTNATGLPISTGVSGLGTGVATALATPSSANMAAAVTDETGTGAMVFATSPTFVTPALGTPASGVATNLTGLPLTTGVTGTLPVANGGTGAATLTGTLYGNGTGAVTATALGGDVTLYGSNGTAPLYYALGITNTSAAVGFARASSTLNLNIPDADASFRGTVSTGTQTFAGAKTFSGAATVQGLLTGSAGIVGTATATVAALNQKGALDMDYRTVTATATLAETDAVLYVGTLTGDITINLPACNATRDGWTFRVMKKGSDAFAFILDPATTETFFDGTSTKSFYSQGNTVTCQCESGSYWNILR